MDNNIIKVLNWDSSFFGFKTGEIQLENIHANELQSLLEEASKDGYRLLYGKSRPEDNISNESAIASSGLLVDEKITFRKELKELDKKDINQNIIEYTSREITDQLVKLSIQSGQYSRFNIDKKIGKGNFERLFKQWVINSVHKKYADEVFVYKESYDIIGFVTLKLHSTHAQIGLIAVDENFRGKSIGSALIDKTELYTFENNLHDLHVITQKNNIRACLFYKKNGFEIYKTENIYHFWIS